MKPITISTLPTTILLTLELPLKGEKTNILKLNLEIKMENKERKRYWPLRN